MFGSILMGQGDVSDRRDKKGLVAGKGIPSVLLWILFKKKQMLGQMKLALMWTQHCPLLEQLPIFKRQFMGKLAQQNCTRIYQCFKKNRPISL